MLLDNTANDGGAIDGIGDSVGGLRFLTSDAGTIVERMRIDSSGNLLINTTTLPTSDSKLTVQNGSHCEVNIISGSSTGSVINMGDSDDYNDGRIKYDNSTRSMQFQTANAERVRIDSSGNVGIGTAAPSRKFHVNGTSKFEDCLLYTSPSPRDGLLSRMPSSA